MCNPMLVMMAATAVSAYSSIQQGNQQKEWADYQADQANADAKADRGASEVHAEKIRKMARMQAGEATAGLAAAGVDTGAGTAININKDITARGEEDALTTILNGVDKSRRMNTEAAALRVQGSQAQSAGYMNAASTALSAYGTYQSRYKTPNKVA